MYLPGQLSQDSKLDLDVLLKTINATLSRAENINSRLKTTTKRAPATELPNKLLTATHMLVHWDSHMPALAPLYDGPYDVLQGSLYTFIIQMGE